MQLLLEISVILADDDMYFITVLHYRPIGHCVDYSRLDAWTSHHKKRCELHTVNSLQLLTSYYYYYYY